MTEIWPYHRQKYISESRKQAGNSNGLSGNQGNPSTYTQVNQQYAPGILRSVRITDIQGSAPDQITLYDPLEYFIFEDDNPENTTSFLDAVRAKPLDFDYAHLRIPPGCINVEYKLNPSTWQLITLTKTEKKLSDEAGFFGTLLLDVREHDQEPKPFIRNNILLHNCENNTESNGKYQCPKTASYGFDIDFPYSSYPNARKAKPGETNFGRLKIFYTLGKSREYELRQYRNSIGSDLSAKATRMIWSDQGFYLIPFLLPEKVVMYAVIVEDGQEIAVINALLAKIKDKSTSNNYIFADINSPILRDDDLSILFANGTSGNSIDIIQA